MLNIYTEEYKYFVIFNFIRKNLLRNIKSNKIITSEDKNHWLLILSKNIFMKSDKQKTEIMKSILNDINKFSKGK